MALSEQVQQIVFRVFRWKSGNYHFDPIDADYDRDNVIPVSTDHILMEGIRRVDEWPIIEKRIPSIEVVFRPLVSPKQIKEVVDASEGGTLEDAFGSLDGSGAEETSNTSSSEVVLNPQENAIYKLVDGKRSVSTIMDLTGLSDFDVCRTLFDFIDRNLVSPAAQEQARSARRSGPRASVGVGPSQIVGMAALLIVLVLSAVGLLVSFGTPFRVPAAPSFLEQESATIQRSRDLARMQRLASALRTYYMTFGFYPNTLDDLVNANPPLVSAEDLRGAGGDTYRYLYGPERIILEAIGPTGEAYLNVVRGALPDEVILPGPPPVGSQDP